MAKEQKRVVSLEIKKVMCELGGNVVATILVEMLAHPPAETLHFCKQCSVSDIVGAFDDPVSFLSGHYFSAVYENFRIGSGKIFEMGRQRRRQFAEALIAFPRLV